MSSAKLKDKYHLVLGSLILLLIVLVVILSMGYSASRSACGDYRTDKVVKTGNQRIDAEVAYTPTQMQEGLGGRQCIASDQGMLFEFSQPGRYDFWMKDMRFSIDMVWINSAKQVVYIQPDVSPATYPQTFVSVRPAQYVLELKASRAAQLGLHNGSRLNF
ncbi:MAG TPA: DUF192 domain-containing protein [Candidatus Saccharimonadales bacterium]|nr:DUF192 domain-containing protein [Candidatus Saccharimonadales bacterium]